MRVLSLSAEPGLLGSEFLRRWDIQGVGRGFWATGFGSMRLEVLSLLGNEEFFYNVYGALTGSS